MFDVNPDDFLPLIGGAFVLGWLIAKFGTFLGRRRKARKRDPRDDRIRSLEAEHRVAKSNAERGRKKIEELEKELGAAKESIAESMNSLAEHMDNMAVLRKDLKDAVKKTRELRHELADRATEGVRTEVKLREVETELEVSRASTNLLATGVLSYPTPEDDDDEPKIVKSVT